MNEERPSSERHGERDSQLSAMFDGELPAAECELLARRLVKDEALRAQWTRYSLIGAAVRAERGVALHDRVAWRVQSAIAQETAYGDSSSLDTPANNTARPAAARATAAAGAGRFMRFARPVIGAGIAAGVAALSILWLRTQDSPDPAVLASNTLSSASPAQVVSAVPQANTSTLAANTRPATAHRAASREPGAYTTPAPSSQNNMAPPARLANYVVAHSEYSGPLSRRLALLSVVGNEGTTEAVPADGAAQAGKKQEASGNGH